MGHPLFPADTDAEDFECSWVSIAREERGSWITAPEMFPADQLQSLEQIQQRYGGGHYQLSARHGGQSGRQLITRRVNVRLPGPSLALDGTSEPPNQSPPPVGVASMPGVDPQTALLIQMMQQAEARSERSQQAMMQMFMAAQQANAQVLVAALGNRGGDGGAAAVSQLASTMVQALTNIRTPRTLDGFKEGIEFAAKFQGGDGDGGAGGGGDEAGVIESLGTIAAGMSALNSMVPPGGAQVPSATVVPHAPPRSAAPASAPPDPNRQPLPHAPGAGAGGGGRG